MMSWLWGATPKTLTEEFVDQQISELEKKDAETRQRLRTLATQVDVYQRVVSSPE